MRLAKSRAEHLKDYVVKEFNVDFVETYNMAKRPNAIQEIFKTTTAKVKTTLEKGGVAPSSPEDTGILGLKGKTASALVLIYVK